MAEVDNSLRQSERVHKLLSSEWVVLFYVSLGRCIDGNNTFTCTCDPGFVGRTCNIDNDDCSSSPCIHGTKNNSLLCYNNNNNNTGKITEKKKGKRKREEEKKNHCTLNSLRRTLNARVRVLKGRFRFIRYLVTFQIVTESAISLYTKAARKEKSSALNLQIGSLYSNRTNYHFSFSWFFVAPTYGIQQQSPDSLWRKASAGASIS